MMNLDHSYLKIMNVEIGITIKGLGIKN